MRRDNILAIETSTSECSVALQMSDGRCLELSRSGNNIHSQVVLPLVKELLDSAQLKLSDLASIGVCRGPGSFTGLRIGIGVAQGLAYGAGVPMFGFSSLDVLVYQQAQSEYQARQGHLVLAALDARMQEVYWAPYLFAGSDSHNKTTSTRVLMGDVNVLKPQHIELPREVDLNDAIARGRVSLLGNAWSVYPELALSLGLPNELLPQADAAIRLYPMAIGLIRLFNKIAEPSTVLESASDFAPLYVRNNVAAKPKPSLKPVGGKTVPVQAQPGHHLKTMA